MYIYEQKLEQSQITQDNKEMSAKSLVRVCRKLGSRSRRAVHVGGKVETKKKILGVPQPRRNFGGKNVN